MFCLNINQNLIRKFENTIDTLNPDKSRIPINILGYGEISLVFEFQDNPSIAYKRLPIFESIQQVKRHVKAYRLYNEILSRLDIPVPSYDAYWLKPHYNGPICLYCAQQKIDPNSIGNKIIHVVTNEEIRIFVLLILQKLAKIWFYNNQKHTRLKIGIDGQISNWSIIGYNANDPKITLKSELSYLDTSTPLFRINGVDAMEPVLFLRSAPTYLRFVLKALFLEDVVGRYYDLRLVIIDLIANFFKEQRKDIIPVIIKVVNDFLAQNPLLNVKPLSYREIKSYYDEDKQIWIIFQNARRLDRWILTKLFRKRYHFYLPGKITR